MTEAHAIRRVVDAYPISIEYVISLAGASPLAPNGSTGRNQMCCRLTWSGRAPLPPHRPPQHTSVFGAGVVDRTWDSETRNSCTHSTSRLTTADVLWVGSTY